MWGPLFRGRSRGREDAGEDRGPRAVAGGSDFARRSCKGVGCDVRGGAQENDFRQPAPIRDGRCFRIYSPMYDPTAEFLYEHLI
jgi:hypothetical protein